MPLCTSMPSGLLACSGGMGHTRGALSLQDTWQMKEHTGKSEGERELVYKDTCSTMASCTIRSAVYLKCYSLFTQCVCLPERNATHSFLSPPTHREWRRRAWSFVCMKPTFAGVALAEEAHHQGAAVGALGGAGEGLDAQLVSFGLQTHTHGERRTQNT